MTERLRELHLLELVALGVLGLLGLCSASLAAFSLLARDDVTGYVSFETVPLFAGPFLGALGSMAMIWLRDRATSHWTWLSAAILLWFVGVSTLGMGVFAALMPTDDTFLANLGFSVLVCFGPGFALTLIGSGIYWLDRRRRA